MKVLRFFVRVVCFGTVVCLLAWIVNLLLNRIV